MPITPLPQFEADLAEHLAEQADREAYERLNIPKTLVVRFGVLKMVGEFPYDGDAKPGCGSKIVVRTHRGTEIGEMLTSTCPNAGCSKSVTRKQMLEYIDNSGGRDYPFSTDGRALRVATKEDTDRQAALDAERHGMAKRARAIAEALRLPLKIVEAEPLLGGERVTYYYHSEERVDFRGLLQELRPQHDCRIELRQVGARDEARITADYERCGQYCCCKNFLKVLKPVSMKSAKTQKATLDPLKISGRCGRLMCCLRYEDETYEELRKRLPKRGARVGTPEGDGTVVDGQILTQLVLVALDGPPRQVAVPVENLTEPGLARPQPTEPPPARRRPEDRPRTGSRPDQRTDAPGDAPAGEPRRRKRRRRSEPGTEASPHQMPDRTPDRAPDGTPADAPNSPTTHAAADTPASPRKRRRRRAAGGPGIDAPSGDRSAPAGEDRGPPSEAAPDAGPQEGSTTDSPSGPRKKRRRRRRRSGPDAGPGTGQGGGPDSGDGGGGGGPTTGPGGPSD